MVRGRGRPGLAALRRADLALFVVPALVGATVLGVGLMFERPARAGLDRIASSAPWAARIQVGSGDRAAVCSGVLVATDWVVTAGHCVLATGAASALTVTLGGPDALSPAVDAVHVLPRRWNDAALQWEDDVALLHLASAVDSERVAVVADAGALGAQPPVAVVGYGGDRNHPAGSRQAMTRFGDWRLGRCEGQGTWCAEPTAGSVSFPAGGDSGAAAVARGCDGRDVVIGIFTGPGPSADGGIREQYGQSLAAHRQWLASTMRSDLRWSPCP